MIYVLVSLIGFILGIALSIYGVKRKIEIKFSYSKVAWIEPVMGAVLSFLIAFIIELIVGWYFNNSFNSDKYQMFLVKKFFENGLLIPILSIGISFVFEKNVESLNLDYSDLYTDKVSKLVFSVIIILSCIKIVMIAKFSYGMEYEFVINRVLMWLLTVIGTWIGFGFNCEGRIEKENKIRRRIRRNVNAKERLSFWFPVILSLFIGVIIFFLSDNVLCDKKIIRLSLIFACSFLISGLITLAISTRLYKPSEKASIKDFYKAFNAYKNNKQIEKHFGLMSYSITNENNLLIKSVDIKYPNHEEDKEFKRLFGEEQHFFGSIDEARNYLIVRNKEQTEFIRKAFDKCIYEEKERLIEPFELDKDRSRR